MAIGLEMRRALRGLVRRPAWTVAAVVTLGLAIGASTAVFSVLDAAVLRPQPYPQPDGVLGIYRQQPSCRNCPISRPAFLDLAAGNDAELTVAGFNYAVLTLIGREGPAERIAGVRVSPDYFGVFRLSPARGRWLGAADDAADAEPAVVISHKLWQRRFAGAESTLGSALELAGRRYTVVGIAPQEFDHPAGIEAWLPAQYGLQTSDWGSNYIALVARRGDDVALERVAARLDAVAARWRADQTENYANLTLNARTLHDIRTAGVRDGLGMLLGAVFLVLLVACANVANMLLTRTLGRGRELATRAALGAGPWRLGAGALAESFALTALGCVAGVGFALAGVEVLVALAPPGLPRLDRIALDGRALGFAFALTLFTGALAGVMPAVVARHTAVAEALRSGSKTASGGGRHAWRRGLVAAELALSVVLLVGATLMIQSLARLSAVDPGFPTDRLLTGMITLPSVPEQADAAATDAEQRRRNVALLASLRAEIGALPGVVSVGAIDSLPVSGDANANGGVQVEGRDRYPPGEEPVVEFRAVSPGYFATMGLALVKGETFRDGLPEDGPFPIVVNEALVARLFPDQEPLGQRVIATDGQPHPIIGVVRSAKQWGLDQAAADPELYMSYQHNAWFNEVHLVIRTQAEPTALAEPLRRAIGKVNPDVPLFAVRTMDEVMARTVAQRRFAMTLLTAFAIAAVLIASVGLYGVMSYTVELGTHDIGVRMALGAGRERVLQGTLAEGLVTAGAGVALGIVVAYAASGLLASLVFGVSATDPATYLLAAAALLATAALATWVPAWRAASVQPVEALRYE